MKHDGIRKTLFVSHVGVALVSLILITILVNTAVYFSFGGYIRNQQKAEANGIVQELLASYSENEGWTMSVLMAVSHRAMLQNYVVRITDSDGRRIWDSSTMNGQMPGFDAGGEPANDRLKSAYQIPIVKDGVSIGTVWLGSTAGIYHDQEKSFLLQVNVWIWIAFIAVMIGVYGFSKRLSSQISRPLLQIKDTANHMTEGDLKARVRLEGGQSEIHAVGEALNHLAETLLKQEKLRKTMTADIAHELRTPVATIRSHIEAFQDGIWESSPDKLDICHIQIMQLSHLIQDLEKLAEAENPMVHLQKEKVNLITIIHEAQRTVQESEGNKQIHYKPPAQEEVVLMGDYRRLLQIFINLLSNAYKYTLENGSVQVQVSEDPQYTTILIRDTGLGILPEELPYIFERFYRGEKSRNRKLGGAGIGLAVVKALVEAHDGSITAESVIREGTIITVRLPKL